MDCQWLCGKEAGGKKFCSIGGAVISAGLARKSGGCNFNADRNSHGYWVHKCHEVPNFSIRRQLRNGIEQEIVGHGPSGLRVAAASNNETNRDRLAALRRLSFALQFQVAIPPSCLPM